MNPISEELKAIAAAIVESYRTGYSVSPSVLLKLANRAQDMERKVVSLEAYRNQTEEKE